MSKSGHFRGLKVVRRDVGFETSNRDGWHLWKSEREKLVTSKIVYPREGLVQYVSRISHISHIVIDSSVFKIKT